jgi:hypothetical protein
MKALKVTSLHEVVAAFSFFKFKPGIFPPIQIKSYWKGCIIVKFGLNWIDRINPISLSMLRLISRAGWTVGLNCLWDLNTGWAQRKYRSHEVGSGFLFNIYIYIYI